jgi:hypothetical protein
MTTAGMTEQLALLTHVGELMVAIDAAKVLLIRRVAETEARRVERNLYAVDLEARTVPGWDLGELLGLGSCSSAWVIAEIPRRSSRQTIGLRVGRCISVRTLPRCSRLPASVITARRGALAAGFSTRTIPEVQGVPWGLVLELARLLTRAELDAGARLDRVKEHIA